MIQVEADSKGLVDMINETIESNVVIESLLFDIKGLQMQLRLIEFIFTPHSCNRAAHLVA